MSLNLAVILKESAAERPEKPALIMGPTVLSYTQLDALSGQVASSLRRSGVQVGDKVGLMLPNVPQFVIAYFGILKAGAVVVPMNVLLKAPELAFLLGDSEARALVTWQDVAREAITGAADLGEIDTYVVSATGSEPIAEGSREFRELLQGDPGFEMESTSAEDTAVILYTSGTTGRPKGAELTHFNLFMNCHILGQLFGAQPEDVQIAVLPLFHSYGQSVVMNTTIHYGGTITMVPRFDPVAAMEAIHRDRVTLFQGVPTMYLALLHHPELANYDLSSMRMGGAGGASMPGEVMTAFENTFGITILEGYGLSETSPTVSFNRSAEQRRFLSIGKPLWGIEMRIVDEQHQQLPPGSDNVGEIVIRGHAVMKGYYKNPQATAEVMKGGWFHSGDMGYVDEDGYFFIVDRKKEMIIRGGYNVYPREIEEILYGHPAVGEAAVIGIPHDQYGEEVGAAVALKPGARATPEELREYVKERVAAYKYPRHIWFVEELPIGATGKTLKRQIKPPTALSDRAAAHAVHTG